MTTFFHPFDTQKYVIPAEIDNFSLRYTHFLNSEKDQKSGKYKFILPEKIKMTKAGQELIKLIGLRQEFQLKSLSRIYDFRVIEAETDWRLIVGLGGGHVQETGMTLHYIYGIPYIPGSSIKGVLHHWARDNKDKDESQIFGTQEKMGEVIFMDAFPVGNVKFATDIINPHYPKYYDDETYPADWQSPIPVKFLTVEKATFRFIFLSEKSGNSNCLDKITELIRNVFEYKGIGAKTAVGYGYFKNIRDITKRFREEFQI